MSQVGVSGLSDPPPSPPYVANASIWRGLSNSFIAYLRYLGFVKTTQTFWTALDLRSVFTTQSVSGRKSG